ncbi:MAG: hypothetical protein KatS3mg031_2606 [Chitinophagales bacterium]|nr:MAG: hypothetical protein KatS3mg031_2606 [Chitinophagales bacterium]
MRISHFTACSLVVLTSCILFCGQHNVFGATIFSAGSGSFSSGSTWVGGVVPGPSDSAVILTGHSVTSSSNVEVGSIALYCDVDGEMALLDITSGSTLTVYNYLRIYSNAANSFEFPDCQLRVRATLVIGKDLILQTTPGTDPALAIVKMIYSGGEIRLGGNVVQEGGGGKIDARDVVATTFRLNGSSPQTLSSSASLEYHHIIIENTSSEGVTLSGNITASNVFGSITISSGKFNNGGYSISGYNSSRNFTVKNGAEFVISGTAGLPAVFSHVFESGCTIRYAGGGQTVGVPNNGQSYHNLILEGSGTKLLGGNIDVNGNITLGACTLDTKEAFNYGITVAGSWTTNGGTFVQREGVVTFDGNNSSIQTASYFSGPVYVPSGATLYTNGNLRLTETGALMHGSGTSGGGGTVTGAITLSKSCHTGLWNYNFLSSPVEAATINPFGIAKYYYDPSNATDTSYAGMQEGWIEASGTMTPGKGYAVATAGTVSFTGTANDAPTGSPIEVVVKKNVGVSNDIGYNLVGNPFPCGLDASAFMAVNGPNGNNVITGAIYLWDDDQSGTSGFSSADYAVWTDAGAVSGPNSSKTFDGIIASGQGFFVEKIADGVSTIEFRNSMRTAGNGVFFKRMPAERVWLSITSPQDVYNEVLIAFLDDATDSVDLQYDARKVKGNPHLAFYSKIDSGDYAIQALPKLTNDRTVRLGIDAAVAGNYVLSLRMVENLDESVVVLLEDTETGTFHNLRKEPAYTFTLLPGTDIQRFKVHFNPPVMVRAKGGDCAGTPSIVEMEQVGSYTWRYEIINEGDVVVDSGSSWNGSRMLIGLSSGQYTIHLTDSFGYSVEKEFSLSNDPVVTADFILSDSVAFAGQPIYFFDYSRGAAEQVWDFGDGSALDSTPYPVHTYAIPGTYKVTFAAFNAVCSDTLFRFITIREKATGIAGNAGSILPEVYAARDNLIVHFPQPMLHLAYIQVYNLLGQTLLSQYVLANGQYRFSVKGCHYCLVRVTVDGKTADKKILLTR